MKRRNFIKNTISFSLLLAIHRNAQSFDQLANNEKLINLKSARFLKITLYTSKLNEQFEFYSKVLEFPVISKDISQFTLKIGDSILQFKVIKDGSEPFYHYAINIPTNKYEKAKEWLSKKTPLLGGGLFYFDFWDAHAVYFKDPSGNIGELIARHTLKNDSVGEFSVSDLLCISEIGTPVENPSDFASELKNEYNLDAYGESMFIGDENGLFVVVPINRLWFPDFTLQAKVYPTDIVISDKGKKEYQYQNYPYKIKQQK